jgi:nucleophosmin 3
MAMGEIVRIPIAVLKVGETRHCCLDLEFPEPPVTFTLIEGSGPIYLHGSHILGAEEGEDGMDDMGEEEIMDEEDGAEEEEELAKKKAKLATNNVKGAKVAANANNKPAVVAAANKKK